MSGISRLGRLCKSTTKAVLSFALFTFKMVFTNLTGVPCAIRGHAKLKKLYEKILRLADKLPRDAAYRINLESIICHNLAIVNQAGDDIKEIEDGIGCGTIEMLIAQAHAEFDLVHKMLVWKPWEPLQNPPPPGQWQWPPFMT